MESSRFDGVARLLAAGTTRRGGLKAALSLALGGAVAVAAGESASAAHTRCRRGRQTCQRDHQCCSGTCNRGSLVPLKDRNRCACEDGTEQCGNACVDTNNDARNCGACGVRCQAAEVCCNGECIDVRDDEANCGACGTVCDETETCTAGACICTPDCDGKCGDDGCGGQCGAGPYVSPDDESCVTAVGFCESLAWRAGTQADCLVSPSGEAMLACYNPGSGFDYRFGAHCTQTSDCQAWCDGVTSYGCFCVSHQYYGFDVLEITDYSGEGNYCVRKLLKPFELSNALAGDCGDV